MTFLLFAILAQFTIPDLNPQAGPTSFDVKSGTVFIGQWNDFFEIDLASGFVKKKQVEGEAILSILAEDDRVLLSVAGRENKTIILEKNKTSEAQFYRWLYKWDGVFFGCPDLEFAPFLAVKLFEDLTADSLLFFRPRAERNHNFKRIWAISDGDGGFFVAHQRESRVFHYPKSKLKKLEIQADDGEVATYQLNLPLFVQRPLSMAPFVIYRNRPDDKSRATQDLFNLRAKYWNSFSRVIYFGKTAGSTVLAYTSPECGNRCRQKTVFHKVSDDFEVGPPLILEEEFLVEEDGGLLYLLSVGGSKARIETLSVDLIPDF